MLTSIELRTDSNKSLSFSLDDHDAPIYIKSIEGLDPVDAELVSAGVASADGAIYQSSRRGVRNPVITLGLQDLGEKTIRELRQDLYSIVMPRSQVTIVFYDDEYEPLKLTGRVESFVAPLFQKDPEATISIVCFDPAFYEMTPEVLPFVMGTDGIALATVPYKGTIENGFELEVTIRGNSGAPKGISITVQRSDGVTDAMEILYPFIKNDILRLSTIKGSKLVTLTRGNQTDSILYALTYQSPWAEFSPGSNNLRVIGPFGASNTSLVNLTWTNKHGGL